MNDSLLDRSSYWAHGLRAFALGCGGGGESAPLSSTQAVSATANSVIQLPSTPMVSVDQASVRNQQNGGELSAAGAIAVNAVVHPSLSAVLQPKTSDTNLSAANTDSSLQTSRSAVVGGTSASNIAAPIAGCASVNVGLVYSSSTAPSGSYTCYQFVVNVLAKIDSQVALPTGVTGWVGLYLVNPTTGLLTTLLDSDQTPGSPLLAQTMVQYARIVLAVQPTSGTGGQTFQFGMFNRAGFDSYEVNDKASHPSVIAMNQTVNANIDVAGVDQDYYFYPLNAGQTSAEVTLNFTANQSAGIRVAQQTGPGTFVWAAETAIPFSASGTTFTFNGLPANTSGTTTPYGVMVRVSGTTTATAAQSYNIRAGVVTGWASTFNITNNENISHWYPRSGYLQVANYVQISLTVTDHFGQAVAGEQVELKVNQNDDDLNKMQVLNLITDSFGKILTTVNFSACSGIVNAASYSTYAVNPAYPVTSPPPLPYWSGTAQFGSVTVNLKNTVPIASDSTSITYRRFFTRICSEQYHSLY